MAAEDWARTRHGIGISGAGWGRLSLVWLEEVVVDGGLDWTLSCSRCGAVRCGAGSCLALPGLAGNPTPLACLVQVPVQFLYRFFQVPWSDVLCTSNTLQFTVTPTSGPSTLSAVPSASSIVYSPCAADHPRPPATYWLRHCETPRMPPSAMMSSRLMRPST